MAPGFCSGTDSRGRYRRTDLFWGADGACLVAVSGDRGAESVHAQKASMRWARVLARRWVSSMPMPLIACRVLPGGIAFNYVDDRREELALRTREHHRIRLPFFSDLTLQKELLDVVTGLGGLAVVISGAVLVNAGTLQGTLPPADAFGHVGVLANLRNKSGSAASLLTRWVLPGDCMPWIRSRCR